MLFKKDLNNSDFAYQHGDNMNEMKNLLKELEVHNSSVQKDAQKLFAEIKSENSEDRNINFVKKQSDCNINDENTKLMR